MREDRCKREWLCAAPVCREPDVLNVGNRSQQRQASGEVGLYVIYCTEVYILYHG